MAAHATRKGWDIEGCGAAGNPFAPPGTLRSRPASAYVEAGPSHGRSISLPQADLPTPAVLADYAASLSLPHPSHTVSSALAPPGSQCTHLPMTVLVESLSQGIFMSSVGLTSRSLALLSVMHTCAYEL